MFEKTNVILTFVGVDVLGDPPKMQKAKLKYYNKPFYSFLLLTFLF